MPNPNKKKNIVGGREPRTNLPAILDEPVTFRLLPGGHFEHRAVEGDEINGDPVSEGSLTMVEVGDTVTTTKQLDKLFVNRFEIIPTKKKKLKKAAPVEEEEDLEEPEDEHEDEDHDDEGEPEELDEDDPTVEKMNENDKDDVPAKKKKKKKLKKGK